MRSANMPIVLFATGFLAGCNAIDSPLVFGKFDTFGASASVTAPEQGGNVVVGYRSAKLAVVPVTAHDAAGNVEMLTESREQTQGTAGENTGAFSTFAHFEGNVGAAPGVAVCLGDTFATGLAAQEIAENLPNVCANNKRP